MDPAVGDLLRQTQPITIRAPPRLRSGEFPAHVADSLYFRRRCLRRVGYLLPYPLLDRFGADRPDLDPRDHLRRPRRRQREQGTVVPLPGEYPAAEIIRPKDRKSTRLNSSHVSSSYAVFCLTIKTLIQRT